MLSLWISPGTAGSQDWPTRPPLPDRGLGWKMKLIMDLCYLQLFV